MDARHLIKSGQTSFTISLPIDWIKKHRLARGDLLFLEEKADRLIISPKKSEEGTKRATVEISDKSQIAMEEEVSQQYQLGASHISFTASKNDAKVNKLEQLMQKFPGFELESRDEKKIIYRDLFSTEAVSPEDILRKQDSFVRVMCSELMSTISATKDQVTISHVAGYVSSLQRQHVLLRRQILRKSSFYKSDFALLLVSRALLKTATLIRDFIGTLNLLDRDDVFRLAIPEFKIFSEKYEEVMYIFFSKRPLLSITEKEKILTKIESVKSKMRSSQDLTMVLLWTSLLAMYWEITHVSELVYLAADV